jgi:hypothetical protein
VAALGAAHELRHRPVDGRENAIDPGTRGVHGHPGAHLEFLARRGIAEAHQGKPAVFDLDAGDRAVVSDGGAVGPRRHEILDDHPLRERHLRIVVLHSALQSVRADPRLVFQKLRPIEHPMGRKILAERQQVVDDHADPEQQHASLAALVNRDVDANPVHQVPRGPE